MNITQLDLILGDDNLKQDLLALIARKIQIEQHLASYDEELEDININAKKIGLKPTEFNKIVKCIVNSEATLNELATLERINDHLLGEVE